MKRGAESPTTGTVESGTVQARLRFLAEAGAVLSSSLDAEQILGRIARLAVSFLADWCTVDLLTEDGSVRRVAFAHTDPGREHLLELLTRRYPLHPDPPNPAWEVLRTGRSLFVPVISEETLEGYFRDAFHQELIRQLEPSGVISVPFQVHGEILGALSLVTSRPEGYGPDDLTLAEELARRAALAITNARLYREAEEARELAALRAARSQRLAGISRALGEASLDLATVLSTVARSACELIGDLCVLHLLSEDGEWLDAAASHHSDPDRLEGLRDLLVAEPMRAGEGFTGRVVRTGEAILLAETDSEEIQASTKPGFRPFLDR